MPQIRYPLINIIGTETALEPLLESLAGRLADYVDNYNGDAAALKQRYMQRLYRGDGREYTFLRPDGTQFRAAITDVETDGTLHPSPTAMCMLSRKLLTRFE